MNYIETPWNSYIATITITNQTKINKIPSSQKQTLFFLILIKK